VLESMLAMRRRVGRWLPPVWLLSSLTGRSTAAPARQPPQGQVVPEGDPVAQPTITTLTDDLDPDLKAQEAVAFSLDGMAYELDLTMEHSNQLRQSLQPYLNAGRRTGGPRATRSTAKTTPTSTTGSGKGGGPDPSAVRAWAKGNGIQVNERGRIKATVVAQFLVAHR